MTNSKIISKFGSLSVIELLTLQRLLKHQEPVVRYVLYQEINQFSLPEIKEQLNAEEIFSDSLKTRELSTSSFYNSLKTLERYGLVSFNYAKTKTKSGREKIETVEATEEARLLLNTIFNYFFYSIIDDYDYFLELTQFVLNRIGSTDFSNILTVNLTGEFDVKQLRALFELANDAFILCTSDIFKSLERIGFENIKHSSIYNNKIREPKGIFDVAVIPNYKKDSEFYGLSRISFLKEVKRVVSENGVVVLTVRSPLPQTGDFYAQKVLDAFGSAVEDRVFTKQEIKNEIEQVGFSQYEVIDYKGLIIVIGWV
ncbi:MAG: hypothetical protein GF353_11770 [Candidatus Lokiarchaeota archaeon]|nr:hypothetical protein [Candidatus Lokiarchaeota archaeon]